MKITRSSTFHKYVSINTVVLKHSHIRRFRIIFGCVHATVEELSGYNRNSKAQNSL